MRRNDISNLQSSVQLLVFEKLLRPWVRTLSMPRPSLPCPAVPDANNVSFTHHPSFHSQARTIFESLDLAWSLLRSFPKELLKKITKKQLEAWYSRRAAAKQAGASEMVAADTKDEE